MVSEPKTASDLLISLLFLHQLSPSDSLSQQQIAAVAVATFSFCISRSSSFLSFDLSLPAVAATTTPRSSLSTSSSNSVASPAFGDLARASSLSTDHSHVFRPPATSDYTLKHPIGSEINWIPSNQPLNQLHQKTTGVPPYCTNALAIVLLLLKVSDSLLIASKIDVLYLFAPLNLLLNLCTF